VPWASDQIPISDQASAGPLRITASDYVAVSDHATARLVSAGPVAINAVVKVEASARAIVRAPSPRVTITDQHVDIELQRTQWDFATLVGGVSVGALVGRFPGALIGGCVCLAWGRWRWNQSVRRD
jgi:hypothetical protein